MNLTIFDYLYPKYKIKKPIRLIELFGGYGSQALALKYLGVEFEHWKLVEWAVKSIQAYKDIHFTDVDVKMKDRSKEEMVEFLFSKGISSNYNEPMTKQQISRLSEEQLKTIIKNIYITHNLVDISQVKGKDLEIVDTDKYCYIMTYSFPCQDLSLAGNRALMSDTSTRSGLLWEVERILTELEEKPQILLMENVPQVHGEGAKEDFNKWQLRLEELGYKNYWQDLIATDYGIPQTRNRCFMISILGEYNYTFPKPIPLKLKLKDLLEDNVDEKYFLSNAMIQHIESRMPSGDFHITTGINVGNKESLETAGTITTRAGNRATDNYLIENDDYDYSKEKGKIIRIKNATKKGYLEATDGDGVDISGRMEHHRGTVQKGKTQTLSTMGGENNGVVVGTYQYAKSDRFMQGKDRLQLGKEVSDTLQTTQKEGIVNSDLRIRKLTPKECFRLMGVKDEDFEKCAKNQSDSSLYHLAGDSIVVNILMAIFKELLDE